VLKDFRNLFETQNPMKTFFLVNKFHLVQMEENVHIIKLVKWVKEIVMQFITIGGII
jgi:hypothetical protein